MPITDAIQQARQRGVGDEQILADVIKQNPAKKQFFDAALQRGASATQILNEIIRQSSSTTTTQPTPPLQNQNNRIEEAKRRLEALKQSTPQPTAQPAPLPVQKPQEEIELAEKRRKELLARIQQTNQTIQKPAPPPLKGTPVEIIRPVPERPSFEQKLRVRIVISAIGLVFLATLASLWYWYFKIRPNVGPGPSGSPFASGSSIPTPSPTEVPIPSPLFPIDEQRTFDITDSSQIPALVANTLNEPLQQLNQFRYVSIRNTKDNVIVGLRAFADAMHLRISPDAYQYLGDKFNLFIYSQQQGTRLGLVADVVKKDELVALLKAQEPTMKDDFKPLLTLQGMPETLKLRTLLFNNASSTLKDYEGPEFRYLNITAKDLKIAYLINNDYFILTNSLASMGGVKKPDGSYTGVIGKLNIKPVLELTLDLKLNSNGPQVRLLQKWLNQEPGTSPKLAVNGYYGYATRNAVIKFQEKYFTEILAPQGLTRGTGRVDALTRAKLNSLYGTIPTP